MYRGSNPTSPSYNERGVGRFVSLRAVIGCPVFWSAGFCLHFQGMADYFETSYVIFTSKARTMQTLVQKLKPYEPNVCRSPCNTWYAMSHEKLRARYESGKVKALILVASRE